MRAGRVALSVIAAWTLIACGPAADEPITGAPSLLFSHDEGGRYTFDLANGTDKTIRINGHSKLFEDFRVHEGQYKFECLTAEGLIGAGPAAFHGPEPKIRELGPGERMRVVVALYGEQAKTGKCRFHVKLEDGAVVVSDWQAANVPRLDPSGPDPS